MRRPTSNQPGERAVLLRESEQALFDERPPVEGERGSNVPEISVSELSAALKRTVEDRFGFVRLRGEISNYRGPHASGHAYFCLKDESARIDAVVWRTTLQRMRIKPEEGLEVIASGKITTFPGKSSYQIVVESIEPAGLGALMALLEERRLRLAAEGLFDAARKKALPYLPRVIGVVTSPTGAVIRDILHRVAARFHRHVIVWPVRVQGETSGSEVAAAILGFNAHSDASPFHRPDLIIVARGGGSLEDLWGFNDEAVVRAAAASLIPLISAVGHETDWTLIDHAADLRAPTPTGAAELALPVHAELADQLDRLRRRQSNAVLREIERAQSGLRSLVRHLPSGPAELLALPQQRLDRSGSQLHVSIRRGHDQRRLALARLTHRLGAQSPQAQVARIGQKLAGAQARLERAVHVLDQRRRAQVDHVGFRLTAAYEGRRKLFRADVQRHKEQLQSLSKRFVRAEQAGRAGRMHRVGNLGQLLATLSYRSVLARGYAVVHGEGGAPLRTAAAVGAAGRFSLEMADGQVLASVRGDTAEPAGQARGESVTKSSRKSQARHHQQASLFDP